MRYSCWWSWSIKFVLGLLHLIYPPHTILVYGWRSAEVENLEKMRKGTQTTERWGYIARLTIIIRFLRYQADLLRAKLSLHICYFERESGDSCTRYAPRVYIGSFLHIASIDKSRIKKSLHTTHPAGTTPLLQSFPSEYAEASSIALEIKRMVAQMGGILHWGDFAVLRESYSFSDSLPEPWIHVIEVRFNALSRSIESALQKEGIPSKVLGGHKFFERLEVVFITSFWANISDEFYSI